MKVRVEFRVTYPGMIAAGTIVLNKGEKLSKETLLKQYRKLCRSHGYPHVASLQADGLCLTDDIDTWYFFPEHFNTVARFLEKAYEVSPGALENTALNLGMDNYRKREQRA